MKPVHPFFATPQVPVVERESERCPDDFPYEEHGLTLTITSSGLKQIFVKVNTVRNTSVVNPGQFIPVPDSAMTFYV